MDFLRSVVLRGETVIIVHTVIQAAELSLAKREQPATLCATSARGVVLKEGYRMCSSAALVIQ